MAAQQLSEAGHKVAIIEAMPSPGRKFLMAGKTGLNLTKNEAADVFLNQFDTPIQLRPMLDAFGPKEVSNFALGHGQDIFTGSTGRVFPKKMKASPLLRAWVEHLSTLGVTFLKRCRWSGPLNTNHVHNFETQEGTVQISAPVMVLALGGSSWSKLGSDGAWSALFATAGISITPFTAANVGMRIEWSEHMVPHFGQPLKNICLSVAKKMSRGECVITSTGVEGGAIYALGRELRQATHAELDLAPQIEAGLLHDMFALRNPKQSLGNFLRKYVKLDAAKRALFFELTQPTPQTPDRMVKAVKKCQLPLLGTQPIDEAISTGGGVSWKDISPNLMLNEYPGIFCAGEMLDWEAPTGGYLITACMATGHWAGAAAARYASDKVFL